MKKQKMYLLPLDEDIHQLIKERALNRKMTMKSWMLMAIVNQVKLEEQYEEKK